MKGYKIPEGFVKDYNEWINNYPEDDKYAWGMNAVVEAIEAYPLEELDENPWHTGIPTQDGWYLVKTPAGWRVVQYDKIVGWVKFKDKAFIKKWQKIEDN